MYLSSISNPNLWRAVHPTIHASILCIFLSELMHKRNTIKMFLSYMIMIRYPISFWTLAWYNISTIDSACAKTQANILSQHHKKTRRSFLCFIRDLENNLSIVLERTRHVTQAKTLYIKGNEILWSYPDF